VIIRLCELLIALDLKAFWWCFGFHVVMEGACCDVNLNVRCFAFLLLEQRSSVTPQIVYDFKFMEVW